MSAEVFINYPFAAIVGQESLKTALLLAAVDPRIGGVLVCGEKGTAKSTAVRGLAELFPPLSVVMGCPFHCDPTDRWAECPHCSAMESHTAAEIPLPIVNMPLGATEDRVLGTLDFEKALRDGRKTLQPGLLAEAHRGVLYVDEVNLLSDHLVDVLLDAAAMGVNTIQREGIALTHPARFILIGTMNPEEGELRPQLLDRFGLMVKVTSPREPALRAEVVRRRMAFEESPAEFVARWSHEHLKLREHIATASRLLEQVGLDESILKLITKICCELEVEGLRGDIMLYKTSRALAALDGRTHVTPADVRTAADLVLLHRRGPRASERPDSLQQQLDQLCQSPPDATPPTQADSQPKNQEEVDEESGESPADECTLDDDATEPQGSAEETQLFPLPAPQGVRPIQLEKVSGGSRATHGRRNGVTARKRGQYVRAVAAESPTDIAVDATIRAAVQRGAGLDGSFAIQPSDLRQKERNSRAGTLILFVVDASGSMAARRRMEAVKGAVLSLLKDAYHQRDQVAVIAIRGTQSQLLLAPTASVKMAERVLQTLPTGGRTPLAHALTLAADVVTRERRVNPDGLSLLVLVTDGKANVCRPQTSGDPFSQALEAAAALADLRVPALVLDTENGMIRSGRAHEIATAMSAEYLPLEELSAETVLQEVRQRRNAIKL